MSSHVPILRWTGFLFIFLLVMDMVIGYATVHHFVTHHEGVEPSVPLSFGMFLLVQSLLFWSFGNLRHLLTQHERLKVNYEQELNLTRQVMDCAGAGLGVLDEGGRLVYVNPALAHMLGEPAQVLVGQHITRFLSASSTFSQLHEVPTEFTASLKQVSGQSRPVHIQCQPRWHAGRIVGSVLSLMPSGLAVPDTD